MKLNRNQRGNAFMKVILGLVLVVFLAAYGFQIGMGYFEKSEINSAVQKVLDEPDLMSTQPHIIKSKIAKQLSVSNINIPDENIIVQKSQNHVIVTASYEKIIKINNTVSIVMNLGVEDER